MKLCIIGNSHIAALKLAWDSIRDQSPSYTPSFFGVRGRSLLRLEAVGGRLRSDCAKVCEHFTFTSGGQAEVVLSDFDAFAVVGGALGIVEVMELYRSFRSDEHSRSGQYLLSQSAFSAAAKGLLLATPAAHVCRLLQQSVHTGIALLPAPSPSEAILTDPMQGGPWREAADSGDLQRLEGLFDEILAEFAGDRIRLVKQPAETKARRHFTADSYSRGSCRLTPALDEPHADDDYIHMNAAYGASSLREVMNALGARTAGERLSESGT